MIDMCRYYYWDTEKQKPGCMFQLNASVHSKRLGCFKHAEEGPPTPTAGDVFKCFNNQRLTA